MTFSKQNQYEKEMVFSYKMDSKRRLITRMKLNDIFAYHSLTHTHSHTHTHTPTKQ